MKIAYVHIRSMNQSSLEVFENEINRYWNAQGIIVDIRYNGGGNTDQQLLDILERRPYEYWNNRWAAPSAGRRPRQAIAGPKVMEHMVDTVLYFEGEPRWEYKFMRRAVNDDRDLILNNRGAERMAERTTGELDDRLSVTPMPL